MYYLKTKKSSVWSSAEIGWKLVFCCQNCSGLLWERNVLVIEKNLKFEAEGKCIPLAEGQEFVKFLRSLEQLIQTVKGQNNFW